MLPPSHSFHPSQDGEEHCSLGGDGGQAGASQLANRRTARTPKVLNQNQEKGTPGTTVHRSGGGDVMVVLTGYGSCRGSELLLAAEHPTCG